MLSNQLRTSFVRAQPFEDIDRQQLRDLRFERARMIHRGCWTVSDAAGRTAVGGD